MHSEIVNTKLCKYSVSIANLRARSHLPRTVIRFNFPPYTNHPFRSRSLVDLTKSNPVLACNTHLPNIFTRRDPRAAARSAARLRATKTAGRIRNGHTTSARRGSTGPVYGANSRRNAGQGERPRRLRRCNDVIRPPPRTPPRLPGAYVLEPLFVVSDVPETDDPHLFALVQGQLSLMALYAVCQVLLSAAGRARATRKG